MNKRLLYGGATVSLIAMIAYFNLTNIANWWVAKKDAQKQQEWVKSRGNDTLPYFKNQFVVTLPKDSASAKLLKARLNNLGIYQIHDCACSAGIGLWGTTDQNIDEIYVDAAPEQGDPDDPTSSIKMRSPKIDTTPPQRNFKGFNIVKNYKMVESTHSTKILKPLKKALNRFPQFLAASPEVIVATIDSGVDTLVPGIYPSLYRSNGFLTLCKPPTTEGVYGWNMINPTNAANQREPYDNDEVCYSPFSVRRGHGTLINGIIGGMGWYPNQVDFTNNANVNVKLLNTRYFDKRLDFYREGSLFDVLCAINYAIEKKAKVINCSWYIEHGTITDAAAKYAFRETLIRAKNENVILVMSAGNQGIKGNAGLKIWPAAFSRDIYVQDNVIAVGSWNTNGVGSIGINSNEGNFVDVYAPGEDIRMYNRSYGSWLANWLLIFEKPDYGTSYAAPFVAREVALLRGEMGNSALGSALKTALQAKTQAQLSVNVFTPAR